MFGSSSPKPQPFQPPPPYTQAPPFQGISPSTYQGIDQMVPQVQSGNQVVASALGKGVSPDLSNYGTGWLNLKHAPTDASNMQQAERDYLQMQGNPQFAQDQSNLDANGQGDSSYGGAYLGQERAMNNLNAFGAGINQQQADFQNVLNARNALYSQPIALQAQQNANNVSRGLGIAGMDLTQSLAGDQYALSNNQGYNNYNLQSAGQHNNYDQGIYGIQANNATAQRGQGLGLIGQLGSAYLGSLH